MDVRWRHFIWDGEKASKTFRERGVSFREGAWSFYDPNGVVIDDIKHSTHEPRQWLIAMSPESRILLVVFTRRDGDLIRLISVRRAHKKERKRYETQ